MNDKVLAVIPARYASTRFPGKIIAPLAGKPLVQHAYERALETGLIQEACIATDAQEVVEALRPFGARVVMTRDDHPSGTDRIAEVAQSSDADVIINVQGDEPMIDPHTIDEVVRVLLDNPDVPMATAKRLITTPEKVMNPNVVKVVCDERDRAIYFSRWPIPYVRDAADQSLMLDCHYEHIGLYGYRRDFVMKYAAMPQTPLEKLEKLEQLRVLENGYPLAVVLTEYESVGVDTPEDLAEAERLFAEFLANRKHN